MTPKPFDKFHYKKDWTQQNKHKLDKKWATFFYEVNIFFNIVRHSMFIEVVKVTSKSQI
jgi:hypothetical protein